MEKKRQAANFVRDTDWTYDQKYIKLDNTRSESKRE